MGMRLFWRFASDAGTITATSTAAAGFAAANLARDTLSKLWRSGAVLATETITVDLGSAIAATAFALWGHNITEDDTLTLTYASDAGFTTDTGTIPITWREGYLLEFFDEVTRQHWKLDILKDAASDVKQAGRIMIGPHYELTTTLRAPGETFGGGAVAAGKQIRTEGGSSYGDISVALDKMKGTITGLSADDVDEIETMKDTILNAKSFVAAADWDDLQRRVQYGRLDGLAPPTSVARTAFQWNFAQTEQK